MVRIKYGKRVLEERETEKGIHNGEQTEIIYYFVMIEMEQSNEKIWLGY